MKKHRFTLTETIIVMAVTLMLMFPLFKLYCVITRTSRDASAYALDNQKVTIIRTYWRNLVTTTDRTAWTAENGVFKSGECQARSEDRQLTFVSPGHTAQVTMPRGMTAQFTVERPPGLAPAALLTLSWMPPTAKNGEPHRIRLVAALDRNTTKEE